jgi:hypothetical protein
MTRPAKRIALVLGCVLLLGIATAVLTRDREPSYRGKSLTDWVAQWQTNRWRSSSNQEAMAAAEEARLAVRAIGTDGIPFCLKLMRLRESPWPARLRKIVPRRWYKFLPPRNTRYDKMQNGADGLTALKEMAGPAVPGLMQLASAPEGETRSLAIWTLAHLGPTAEPAIPLLIYSMGDPDQAVRFAAIQSLGMIGRQPEVVVPALARQIDFARALNRKEELRDLVNALATFGTNAASSAPAIIPFLRDRDSILRELATNALDEIIGKPEFNLR